MDVPMLFTRILLALLAGTAALTFRSHPASAQVRWNLEASGGLGLPTGDLADAADPGPAFGLGAGYWILPKLGLRIDAQWQRLAGHEAGDLSFPDVDLGHYTAALELHLLEPGLVRWTVLLRAGGGLATVHAVRTGGVGSSIRLDESYPAATAGLSVGYDVVVGVNVFFRGNVHAVFGDEEDLEFAPEGEPDPGSPGPPRFGTTVSFPLELGVRLDFFAR